jgi:hypothetical protein
VRYPTAVAIAACIGLVAGCGNARTRVPSLTRPAATGGFHTLRFPAAGVSFSAPRNWQVISQQPPLVTVVASGNAVIALWRHLGGHPAPGSEALLRAARTSLFAAVRARQGSVRVIGSRTTHITGAPAIEFNATETIGGRLRQVLSTHVFADGAEVVLEEYAPPEIFPKLRHAVFARVRHSLAVGRVTSQ